MTRLTTILVADDQPIVADALSASLGRWFHVVGSVTTLSTLDLEISARAPDIVLLDLAFGKSSALEILPRLVDRHPGTLFVILTAHAEPVLADAALRAGAVAYVVKHSATSELKVAIEEVLAGRTYLTPRLHSAGAGGAALFAEDVTIVLSDRQRSILGLLRAGLPYRVIATRLAISTKTVEYHVNTMTRRLGIRGKAQLIRWSERFFRDQA